MMSAKASNLGEYHPWTTYIYGREEARRRGDRRVGTEHLVLGLLHEPGITQILGCDLAAARETLEEMDRDALAAIGVDRALAAPPAPTREPSLGGHRPSLKAVMTDRLPMTPVAKRVLEQSGKDARGRRRERRWSPELVLSALLSLAAPDPGAAVFDALGVDRAAVGARLREARPGDALG
jgi:hypothetical protein